MPRKRNRQKRSEDLSRRGFLKGSGTGAVAAGDGPTILGSTDKAGATHPIVGSGDHTYEVIHNWGELPKHIRYGNTHGVRIDRDGFVYVHHTVHASSETGDSMVIFDPRASSLSPGARSSKVAPTDCMFRRKETKSSFICATSGATLS